VNNGMVNAEPKRVSGAAGQCRLIEYNFVQLMFLLRWLCLESVWCVLLI